VTDAADLATATSPVTPAVSTWEDPPRGEPTDGAPVLSIDGFAGPLDWLLEMARARKIDLARLSIGALIEAFSRAMQAALAGRDGSRIGHWAAWTVMAATLTELWSRLLLPAGAPEARAAEEEAEALRRQLLDRARMRLAADWLERRPRLGREVFPRGSPELSPAGRVGDLTELLRACLVALRVPEEQVAALRPRPPPLWRASDALPRLRQLLGLLPDGSPLQAFLPSLGSEKPDSGVRARAALSSTLIAGLELARDGVLALEQDAAWTPVLVRRHDDRDAGFEQPGRPA
jgi:segregation and condensation protein A